ncbi:MAG: SDR family NAD(P)-dependent oxidoreductase, partial [Terracidiphilus sp.]
GERFVETLEAAALHETPHRQRLKRNGVYLITGGVGGLGLEVAEELARGYKARLVLVGRSALPEEDAWEAALSDAQSPEPDRARLRRLLAIRAMAGGLIVAQADVTDTTRMKEIVNQARSRWGRIDGVIHAAGVLDDGPLATRTASGTARVLAPKVQGTLALEAALGSEPLDFFVLFSSVSAIAPPAGQVDYAAANAFLDAFAESRGGAVTSINWGPWREAGMAARSRSVHPLLDERLLDREGQRVYASRFAPERQWIVGEHRFRNGAALVPGTGYLEMAAAAFTRGSMHGALEFRAIFFVAPMRFAAGESREVRVQLEGEPRGAQRFSVLARAEGNGNGWREHATGSVAALQAPPPRRVDREAVAARCRLREILFDESNRTLQERHFDFGPRWRCLERLSIGGDEALAYLALDARFMADVAALRQHPALLDLATGAALYLIPGYEDGGFLYLPISYKRLAIFRPLPARFFSHIRARKENTRGGETATFDIVLFDERNDVLAEIEGFTMRRIAEPARAGDAAGAASEHATASTVVPIETPAYAAIPVRAGLRALERILSSDAPRVVAVTCQALGELAPLPAPGKERAPVTAAPASTEPANGSVEATLAAWWQELLGVEKVEADDDFFALGGHSLVGVRLLTRIKKTYAVDLELASLFEARTVREFAALIGRKLEPAPAQPAEERAFATLVPIQPKGSRIPLFCAHAVGGDVLFYEQLAKALGPDQPFYAFKSPLVSQPDVHEISLEELAATYIREMRAFYPKGPYLLGGASYGGLIVFEMARQLYAQGIEPGSILLFDASVPGSEERIPHRGRANSLWQNLRAGGVRYLIGKLGEKRVSLEYHASRRLRRAACAALRLFRLRLPVNLRYFQIEEAHRRALERYHFKIYPGRITLLRATDRGPEALGFREEPTLGWQKLAGGGLRIVDVPTRHMVMLFEPHVSSFAGMVRTLLPN